MGAKKRIRITGDIYTMKIGIVVDSYESLLDIGKAKLDLEDPVFILRMGKKTLVENEKDFMNLETDGEVLKFTNSEPETGLEYEDLTTLSFDVLEELSLDPKYAKHADDIDEALHLKEMEAGFKFLSEALQRVRNESNCKCALKSAVGICDMSHQTKSFLDQSTEVHVKSYEKRKTSWKSQVLAHLRNSSRNQSVFFALDMLIEDHAIDLLVIDHSRQIFLNVECSNSPGQASMILQRNKSLFFRQFQAKLKGKWIFASVLVCDGKIDEKIQDCPSCIPYVMTLDELGMKLNALINNIMKNRHIERHLEDLDLLSENLVWTACPLEIMPKTARDVLIDEKKVREDLTFGQFVSPAATDTFEFVDLTLSEEVTEKSSLKLQNLSLSEWQNLSLSEEKLDCYPLEASSSIRSNARSARDALVYQRKVREILKEPKPSYQEEMSSLKLQNRSSSEGMKLQNLSLSEEKLDCYPPEASSIRPNCYNMNHSKRGIALIFNHKIFDAALNLKPRLDSDTDLASLNLTLLSLGFDVKIHKDLLVKDLEQVMKKTASLDHTNEDCLLVVVMSHGQSGFVYAKDKPYETDRLWSHLSPKKCPTLAGKPKLFIIQACQGEKMNEEDAVSCKIPSFSDSLIAHSSIPCTMSWRCPGSLFIQSICNVLQSNGTIDLVSRLTQVSEKIIEELQSNFVKTTVPQIPCIMSMLTKQIFLSDRNSAIHSEWSLQEHEAFKAKRFTRTSSVPPIGQNKWREYGSSWRMMVDHDTVLTSQTKLKSHSKQQHSSVASKRFKQDL